MSVCNPVHCLTIPPSGHSKHFVCRSNRCSGYCQWGEREKTGRLNGISHLLKVEEALERDFRLGGNRNCFLDIVYFLGLGVALPLHYQFIHWWSFYLWAFLFLLTAIHFPEITLGWWNSSENTGTFICIGPVSAEGRKIHQPALDLVFTRFHGQTSSFWPPATIRWCWGWYCSQGSKDAISPGAAWGTVLAASHAAPLGRGSSQINRVASC